MLTVGSPQSGHLCAWWQTDMRPKLMGSFPVTFFPRTDSSIPIFHGQHALLEVAARLSVAQKALTAFGQKSDLGFIDSYIHVGADSHTANWRNGAVVVTSSEAMPSATFGASTLLCAVVCRASISWVGVRKRIWRSIAANPRRADAYCEHSAVRCLLFNGYHRLLTGQTQTPVRAPGRIRASQFRIWRRRPIDRRNLPDLDVVIRRPCNWHHYYSTVVVVGSPHSDSVGLRRRQIKLERLFPQIVGTTRLICLLILVEDAECPECCGPLKSWNKVNDIRKVSDVYHVAEEPSQKFPCSLPYPRT